jgi:hypothetical protein
MFYAPEGWHIKIEPSVCLSVYHSVSHSGFIHIDSGGLAALKLQHAWKDFIFSFIIYEITIDVWCVANKTGFYDLGQDHCGGSNFVNFDINIHLCYLYELNSAKHTNLLVLYESCRQICDLIELNRCSNYDAIMSS